MVPGRQRASRCATSASRALRPGWTATLEAGETITAARSSPRPASPTSPSARLGGRGRRATTRSTSCDLTALHGARVLIIGGRQSAYEWAALLGEHGAERIDVVHRHAAPRFDRVSWRFVDPHVESTLAIPGWWRTLPAGGARRDRPPLLGGRRLTLEHWLAAAARARALRVRAEREVIQAAPAGGGVDVALSDGDAVHADRWSTPPATRPTRARPVPAAARD